MVWRERKEPEDIPELQDLDRSYGPEYWLNRLIDDAITGQIPTDFFWLNPNIQHEIDTGEGFRECSEAELDEIPEEDEREDTGEEGTEGEQGDWWKGDN